MLEYLATSTAFITLVSTQLLPTTHSWKVVRTIQRYGDWNQDAIWVSGKSVFAATAEEYTNWLAGKRNITAKVTRIPSIPIAVYTNFEYNQELWYKRRIFYVLCQDQSTSRVEPGIRRQQACILCWVPREAFLIDQSFNDCTPEQMNVRIPSDSASDSESPRDRDSQSHPQTRQSSGPTRQG